MKERKITIRVDEVLYKQFKIQLAQNGHTAQYIIEDGIKSYVSKKNPARAKQTLNRA